MGIKKDYNALKKYLMTKVAKINNSITITYIESIILNYYFSSYVIFSVPVDGFMSFVVKDIQRALKYMEISEGEYLRNLLSLDRKGLIEFKTLDSGAHAVRLTGLFVDMSGGFCGQF